MSRLRNLVNLVLYLLDGPHRPSYVQQASITYIPEKRR